MASLKLTEKSVLGLAAPTDTAQKYYWDTELACFGLVVGRTGTKTFIARSWVAGSGKKRKVTIGVHGRPRDDGSIWTVVAARNEAKKSIGQMAAGNDPNILRRKPDARAAAAGPTLRDAYEAHLDKLEKKGRAEATIETLKKGLPKYLEKWMDRPISELTGEVLIDVHDEIKRKAKARTNANPLNPKGGALANRVIAQVSACWSTLNKRMGGKLGTWNPAKSVEKDSLKPKGVRLTSETLPDWYARVQTMRSPIQRDGLMLALFTGLRSEDVRSIRFEHFDKDAWTLRLPDPKGGEARAFTIPLSKTSVEILERRERDNEDMILIFEAGGDAGFAFPGIGNDGGVGPISDLRQQIHHGKEHSRFPEEDVHTLRRTYESVAHEAGISELDLHVLTNHSYASHNVNATYIRQHLDHLAQCQATIDAALWSRLKPGPSKGKTKGGSKKPRSKARHLRAVA
ncbi:MAG: integrase family protein [Kofleriaceae bacterium]